MGELKVLLTIAAVGGLICSAIQATMAYRFGDKDLSKAYRIVAAWQFIALVYLWAKI